jgi:hypothetical protein
MPQGLDNGWVDAGSRWDRFLQNLSPSVRLELRVERDRVLLGQVDLHDAPKDATEITLSAPVR